MKFYFILAWLWKYFRSCGILNFCDIRIVGWPWLNPILQWPLYYHGLTLIPVWINNHMPEKVWNEITYPSPNFNCCTVWEWIISFIPHFYHGCNYLSMLGLKLIPKRGFKWYGLNYRQISNMRCTPVGNLIVEHSDVVGASPVGTAPTTSSFST